MYSSRFSSNTNLPILYGGRDRSDGMKMNNTEILVKEARIA
jgi:hypothetical protein